MVAQTGCVLRDDLVVRHRLPGGRGAYLGAWLGEYPVEPCLVEDLVACYTQTCLGASLVVPQVQVGEPLVQVALEQLERTVKVLELVVLLVVLVQVYLSDTSPVDISTPLGSYLRQDG